MNTKTMSRPEELMLLTKLSASFNAMNHSSDTTAVEFAAMGKKLIELKEESEDYEADVKEIGISGEVIKKSIRLFKEFPEILLPSFQPGADAAINIELRKHPDNPAQNLLDNLIDFIEKHPDFKE